MLTGIAFGTAICLTLFAILHQVEETDVDVFGIRIIIAAFTSIIVFSSHQLLNSLQAKEAPPLFPKLSWRWFIVFMVVLLTAYIDKASEQLSRKVMFLSGW